MAWNPKYALLLAVSTVITYFSGILINYSNNLTDEKKKVLQKRLWVFLSFASNLAILFFFKYFNFALENINFILAKSGAQLIKPTFDIVLPVGISFYTFQALSYTMDIYRKEIKAEKNIARYALFVSFFPQLVAGPIERSKNLLSQVNELHQFDYQRVKTGCVLMLWGFIQKVVIADRLAVFVDIVYKDYSNFSGLWLAVASVFFAFQIYCDFAGYTNIARGAAQVFGFRLMQNFNRPYFATSIQDFWRRWHISLSTWFRDYLYIPLGGGRRGTIRKYINVFITFLVSGLWHGASWTFLFWGALHGIYQIIGQITKPYKDKFYRYIGISIEQNSKISDSSLLKSAKILSTFVLTVFAWIFFRAKTIDSAFYIVRKIFTQFEQYNYLIICSVLLFLIIKIAFKKSQIKFWVFPAITALTMCIGVLIFEIISQSLTLKLAKGMVREDLIFSIALIIFLIAAELVQSRMGSFRDYLQKQVLPIRWSFYYAMMFIIILFGLYGGMTQANFIYFQF